MTDLAGRDRRRSAPWGCGHRWRISTESRWSACRFDRAQWLCAVSCRSPNCTQTELQI